MSRVRRDTPRSVNSSCIDVSTDVRPNSVLVTIGKIEIITHTKMRAPIPPPKTELISGTIASTGSAWAATRYGYIERSIHRAWAITTASAMPSTMLIDRPITAAKVVQAMPVMYCWRTT